MRIIELGELVVHFGGIDLQRELLMAALPEDRQTHDFILHAWFQRRLTELGQDQPREERCRLLLARDYDLLAFDRTTKVLKELKGDSRKLATMFHGLAALRTWRERMWQEMPILFPGTTYDSGWDQDPVVDGRAFVFQVEAGERRLVSGDLYRTAAHLWGLGEMAVLLYEDVP